MFTLRVLTILISSEVGVARVSTIGVVSELSSSVLVLSDGGARVCAPSSAVPLRFLLRGKASRFPRSRRNFLTLLLMASCWIPSMLMLFTTDFPEASSLYLAYSSRSCLRVKMPRRVELW